MGYAAPRELIRGDSVKVAQSRTSFFGGAGLSEHRHIVPKLIFQAGRRCVPLSAAGIGDQVLDQVSLTCRQRVVIETSVEFAWVAGENLTLADVLVVHKAFGVTADHTDNRLAEARCKRRRPECPRSYSSNCQDYDPNEEQSPHFCNDRAGAARVPRQGGPVGQRAPRPISRVPHGRPGARGRRRAGRRRRSSSRRARRSSLRRCGTAARSTR